MGGVRALCTWTRTSHDAATARVREGIRLLARGQGRAPACGQDARPRCMQGSKRGRTRRRGLGDRPQRLPGPGRPAEQHQRREELTLTAAVARSRTRADRSRACNCNLRQIMGDSVEILSHLAHEACIAFLKAEACAGRSARPMACSNCGAGPAAAADDGYHTCGKQGAHGRV